MGYHTTFEGDFTIDPVLSKEHREYLIAFAETRRMKRDADIAETLPDPIRLAAGLPIGYEGAYYVGGYGQNMGQDNDASVLDHNEPPGVPQIPPKDPNNRSADFGERWLKEQLLRVHAVSLGLAQPGLWCQWRPNEDGTAIEWDEGEKFYEYVDWIKYLIAHFLAPWGYTLNGEVYWDGEESGDKGVIRIEDNKVAVGQAVITYSFS